MPHPTVATPRVIGHRGAAGHAPENTLASFRKAAELGAGWVEFDVMLTRDGHAVIFHDETLDRTTDGRGRVAETDLATLRELDAGDGETVPTLDETMAVLAELGLGANVEIKPTAGRVRETGEVAARILDAEWPASLPAPLISSFQEEALAAALAVAPNLPRAYVVDAIPRGWRGKLEALGCGALHCLHSRLTASRASRVIEAGYALRCFTVNDRARAETLFDWGVMSVFSDYPERIPEV